MGLSAMASDDEVSKIVRSVKERKEALKAFRSSVSLGKKCEPRDYECFAPEVMTLVKGHTEDIIAARAILDPFYERSIKEGFPPCDPVCQQNMLANHVYLFLTYLKSYNALEKENYRIELYPTVTSTRIRAYMDLSAFNSLEKHRLYLDDVYKNKVKLDNVRLPKLKDTDFYNKSFELLESGEIFKNSVVCHLSPGDPVHVEIKNDKKYGEWLRRFEETAKFKCADKKPLDFRGTDKATRKYFNQVRDEKMAKMDCDPGNFGCVRTHLRGMGIHYAEDVQKVAAYMNDFIEKSKAASCDETCEAQILVRTIQTWITYFSQYERQKLASTMDWKLYPEARFDTITEDVILYETIRGIFTPIVTKFGSIDPAKVSDKGLRSEMKSVGRDLSYYASVQMLKDSVICTMKPWNASYDRHMVPYKDKEQNKKFEGTFLMFQDSLCK